MRRRVPCDLPLLAMRPLARCIVTAYGAACRFRAILLQAVAVQSLPHFGSLRKADIWLCICQSPHVRPASVTVTVHGASSLTARVDFIPARMRASTSIFTPVSASDELA